MRNIQIRVKTLSRLFFIFIIILLIPAVAACGGKSGAGSSSNLSGSPEDILNQILEQAAGALPAEKPMPMSFVSEVAADTSQYAIGLSDSDFTKYVSSASVSTALIGSFAHEISLIQAKDASSALEIKKLVAADGGYNSHKWICVLPEVSCVIESGSYVLLVASRTDVADAVIAAFTTEAGSTGERDTFFTSEGASAEGAPAGGGMALGIGGAAPLPQ